MSACRIQPENGWRVGSASTSYRQFYPILDWRIFYLTHAEDVARFHALFQQHFARFVNHTHHTFSIQNKGLIV
ncbi:Uncharacterised protein [Vibrio cholerae]|nr:Uncharacterised protein [Vibrio cholerae]CSC41032.1 Uncharacterised protein [Vibrio cholerae]CSD52907.1 Uncharacterised protein [Vibrio cholerae]CSI67416.1 Uncharacterised protein [Vibrio cholerae]